MALTNAELFIPKEKDPLLSLSSSTLRYDSLPALQCLSARACDTQVICTSDLIVLETAI